jgi:hypothetical protein
LDAELRRRNLTESDRVEYQKFVKRQERQEWRRPHRKIPGLKDKLSGRDILGAFAAMALIMLAYFALPSPYRLKSDWEDAAFLMMMTSVIIVVAASSRRKVAFWMSLGISSVIQLVAFHALRLSIQNLPWGAGRGVGVVGVVLFVGVYGVVRFLQRMLYGREQRGSATGYSRPYPVGEKSR